MRFLADMGVSLRVVEWLRSAGHDAVHLRDDLLHKLPNGQIFEKAAQEQRIVMTYCRDPSWSWKMGGTAFVSFVLVASRTAGREVHGLTSSTGGSSLFICCGDHSCENY